MTQPIAVRRIERADTSTLDGLSQAGVATVHEAQGRRGLMEPVMRPIAAGQRMAGSAVTALCTPGDNWMLHVAIELMGPGDVLVVATTSRCTDGYYGDLLGEFVAARGGQAVVLDTGVRDIADLAAQGLPVWARAISAQSTIKETVGAVNVPVTCAGVRVVPGDAVVGDDDGVVVVARPRAAEVLAAAQARIAKEDAMRERIRAGEATLDLLDLRDRLAERGLSYADGPLDWSDDSGAGR